MLPTEENNSLTHLKTRGIREHAHFYSPLIRKFDPVNQAWSKQWLPGDGNGPVKQKQTEKGRSHGNCVLG